LNIAAKALLIFIYGSAATVAFAAGNRFSPEKLPVKPRENHGTELAHPLVIAVVRQRPGAEESSSAWEKT
jgi:hypothetical protein